MKSSFTTSLFHMKTTSGTHRVKILNHSLIKFCKSGEAFQFSAFAVGDYQWAIVYFPKQTGISSSDFYLKLLSEAKDVRVVFRLCPVDKNGETSHTYAESKSCTYAYYGMVHCFPGQCDYLKFAFNDIIILECNLQIIKPYMGLEKKNNLIAVPPSNIPQHLHHLLQTGKGADITFNVKDETVVAHRVILAARSSVFCAELFGCMRESTVGCIDIRDIEPQVFKALLHFIYTDALPPSYEDGTDEHVDEEIMAQHLIIAADRYDLDRLRLLCEEKLAKKIGDDNVVMTLALAEQHNCQQLKEICLDYITSSQNLHNFRNADEFASVVASFPSICKELLEKVDINRRN